MDDKARQKRRIEIHQAAYDLLALHGYGGTSMLRVATAANASNETLYRWYGDKDGLFKEMVQANADETRRLLDEALHSHSDPWSTLESVAPVFLGMILGERAILLNQAAAADPSGMLGKMISAHGRNEIMPLLGKLIDSVCEQKRCDPKDATEWFFSLLIGDLQIRRVINERDLLSAREIETRCSRALAAFRHLLDAWQS